LSFAEPYLFADFRQHSDQLSLSEESLALFGILLLELDHEIILLNSGEQLAMRGIRVRTTIFAFDHEVLV
jgi:hypothetical protein